MYYISKKHSDSSYYVTDTSDKVSELHSLDSIMNFTAMGIEIKGVEGDLIYPTLPVSTPCYIGEYSSPSVINQCVTKASGTTVALYTLENGELTKQASLMAVVDDEGVVVDVYHLRSGKHLSDSAHIIGQCIFLTPKSRSRTDFKCVFTGARFAVKRSIRRDGIYYTSLSSRATDAYSAYNGVKECPAVTLESIIRDADNYSNVEIDGDVVTITALDETVQYKISTLEQVYGRTVSKEQELGVVRSKLLGKTECVVYGNGELKYAKARNGVLDIPRAAKTIARGSLDITECGDRLVINIPDSVTSIDHSPLVLSSNSPQSILVHMDDCTPAKARKLYSACSYLNHMMFDGSCKGAVSSAILLGSDDLNIKDGSYARNVYGRIVDVDKYLNHDTAVETMELALKSFDIESKLRRGIEFKYSDFQSFVRWGYLAQNKFQPAPLARRLHRVLLGVYPYLTISEAEYYENLVKRYLNETDKRKNYLEDYLAKHKSDYMNRGFKGTDKLTIKYEV